MKNRYKKAISNRVKMEANATNCYAHHKLYVACMLFGFYTCFLSSTTMAEVYKWVDNNGRIHYSDKPIEGKSATQIDKPISHYTSASNQTATKKSPSKHQETVVMYSTSWCGYCEKARKHFKARNIPFTEYDIEKNAIAKREYDALGGRGVPVILIGKKRMQGFNKARFNKLYGLNGGGFWPWSGK